jgi:hypothetical protein
MTMIDYLLLGGFFAAASYSVYRLFLGWRHSSSEATLPGKDR